MIVPDAQGKGLATEVVAAALADANFVEPGTTCIMSPQHAASIRVARKNGFAERGLATFMNEPDAGHGKEDAPTAEPFGPPFHRNAMKKGRVKRGSLV